VTLDEIALELGIDERTVRRLEIAAIAKLRAGLGTEHPALVVRAIAIVLAERNYSSTETTDISRPRRRFSANRGSGAVHASRAALLSRPRLLLEGDSGLRARRFFPRNTMKNAEKMVRDFEELELGEPWADLVAIASQACSTEAAAAEAILFPSAITPTTADAVALYDSLISRLDRSRFAEGLELIHLRALTSHPALAALCRSREALDDIGAAASWAAAPESQRETTGAAIARFAAEARARYQLAIARQIGDVPEHELADAALALIAAEDLALRLVAAKERHEEHARAELAKAEHERKAAARAVVDRTVEKVRAAEAALADARAKAEDEAREVRRIKAEALVERLRLSGLSHLKATGEAGPGVFSVADLINTAPRMTIEQIGRYERALAKHEAG
jgi:hypothetical protein